MKRLVVLLILLAALPCRAAEEEPLLQQGDFAYGMELTVSGKNAMYSLLLPAEVYKGCTRPDLGDLRVFNLAGPVPHLLRQPQSEQSTRPSQPLPYFPLSETRLASGNRPDFGIAIGTSGAIIALSAGGSEPAPQVVTTYVLDASALPQQPDWLEFAWAGQGEQFSTSVQIDSSTDLNSWQPLVSSAALAELSFGGHQLLRNRLELPKQAAGKYLRLAWPSGRDGVRLTAVKGGYEQEERGKPRTGLSLVGQPDTEAATGKRSWLFTTEGVFPVDQLNIGLPEQNTVAEFAVFSRANEQGQWQRRASLLAWRLTVDGLQLENGVLHLAPVTDRYWRLETEASSSKAPVLELGWLPGQLVFMAQGERPYTLAYGRAGLRPAHSQVEQLLKAVEPVSGSKLIEAAQAGPQLLLGGKARLEPVAVLPWRQWLLWAGLIAGVLAVGAMALKLFREMNRQQR